MKIHVSPVESEGGVPRLTIVLAVAVVLAAVAAGWHGEHLHGAPLTPDAVSVADHTTAWESALFDDPKLMLEMLRDGVKYGFVPAVLAWRRGYSFLFWLLLAVCTSPWMVLFVLASLPNRALDRRRAQMAASLDDKLSLSERPPPRSHFSHDRSIGDRSTHR